MGISKVVYGDRTLIDLTNDTVSPENLLLGETAHDASGELIVGTAATGGGSNKILKNQTLTFSNLTATILDAAFTATSNYTVFYYDVELAKSCGIETSSSTGVLTFTVDTTPQSSIVCDVVIFDAEGGSGSNINLIETTTSDYDDLPAAYKQDTTKLYFLNDNNSTPVDTAIYPTIFYNKYEASMSIAVSNGKLVYTWGGGNQVGANSFDSVFIPKESTAIKVKLTTGTSYSTTTERFKICVGVKATYQQTNWVTPEDTDWLANVIYNVQNSTTELTIDLSNIMVDSYLMIAAHGWNVTFNEIAVTVPAVVTGKTSIRYKDVPYGICEIEYFLNDGLIGSSGGYVTCNLMKPLVKGIYLICITDSTSIGFAHFKWTGTTQTIAVNVPSSGQLQIAATAVGLTYYSGAYRDIKCDIIKLASAYIEPQTPVHLVEYIESSGTQYINTGITPTTNSKFIITLSDVVGGGGERCIFGVGAYSSNTFLMIKDSGNPLVWYYRSKKTITTDITSKHTVELYRGTVKLDGTVIHTDDTVGATSFGQTCLFTAGANFSDAYKSSYRLYSFQIYTDNVLVFDGVPAIDDNNVPCMYDNVSAGYFYNLGTGAFTPGPDV